MSFVAPLVASIPAGVSTAMTIGGTVLSAVGAISTAGAQAAASDYNVKVANRDAYVEDQNRKLALEQSRIDAEDKRRQNKRVMASMRAQYGASGLSLAGSPLDVLEDTAVEQELDARRIEYEGRVRGREGALRMLGLEEEANLSRAESQAARTSGFYNPASIAASGVGTTLSRVA